MRDLHPYTAQDARVDTLGPHVSLARTLAGLAIILIVSFGLTIAITSIMAGTGWIGDLEGFAMGRTPSALLTLLFSFISVTAGVQLTARLLQKRSLVDILGPIPLVLRQFFRVLFFLAILMLVLLLLPPYQMEQPLELNLLPEQWIVLLPFSLAALLIQTSAEEILFRGYLQQSLAARFRSPAIFILVPSLLFAAGHYVPAQAGDNAWIVAVWAGLFGVLMADLTARAGTLGPAIAIHLFNNFTAIVIVAPASAMNGLALYRLPYDLADTGATRPWLAVDFAMLIVCWLIGRLAIRR